MNSCFSLAVQLQSVRSIKTRMKVALCSATKGGGGILWLRFLRPGVLENHHSTFVGHLLEKLHEQRYNHMSLPHLRSPTVTVICPWK